MLNLEAINNAIRMLGTAIIEPRYESIYDETIIKLIELKNSLNYELPKATIQDRRN